MKKLILLITLSLSVYNVWAQEPKKSKEQIIYVKYKLADFVSEPTNTDLIAVKSKKSDTLFLVNNDMGKNIEQIWKSDKEYKNKPILVFVNYEELKKISRKYTNK